MSKKSITLKRILLLVSIAVAMFFALLTLGKKLIMPFPLEITYDIPTGGTMTDNGDMLVVDSANTRMIFLNPQGKVAAVENLNDTSTISKAVSVYAEGDCYYVRGIKYERHTSVIQSEKLLKYDKDGKNCEVIFEYLSSGRSRFMNLYDCRVSGDKLFYAVAVQKEDEPVYTVAVFSKDLNENEEAEPELVFISKVENAYQCQYIPDKKELYTSDYLGKFYLETEDECIQPDLNGHYVSAFLVDKDGSIIYYDQHDWNLYRGQTLIDRKVNASGISASSEYILFDDENRGSIVRINKANGNREALYGAGFSVFFALLTFLKFISVVYLFGILLFFVLKFLIVNFNNKKYDLLKMLGIIVLSVIISVIISLFYTNNIYQLRTEEIRNQVSAMSEFFANTVDPEVFTVDAGKIDRTIENGTYSSELVDKNKEYEKYFNAYISAEEKNGNYYYVTIYVKDGNRYRLLYDSMYCGQLGENYYYDDYDIDLIDYSSSVRVSSYNGMETMYKLTPIYDADGRHIGAVEVGVDYTVFKEYALENVLEMTMSLMMILAAIYILLSETAALCKGLKERKHRISAGKKNPELSLVRSMNFLFYLVTSLDLVILVLISKDMLTANNCPEETMTWLMVLPSLSVSIGAIIGGFIQKALSKHIPDKQLSVGAVILMTASTAMIIPAVMNNMFFIFCILKLAGSTANTVCLKMMISMPYSAENEKECFKATKSSSIGEVSSGILGALIGGFIAQNWGNVSLYIINTVIYLPLIILLIIVIPKGYTVTANKLQEKETVSINSRQKFILSIPMMTYFIFLMIPLAMVRGYKTYLFPLFAESLEMPKIYITDFYVITRVIMLIIHEPVSKAIARLGHWILTVTGMLIIGASFVGFALNSSFVWAVIMLLIVVVFENIVTLSKSMIWPRQAKEAGLSVVEANKLVWSIEQKINAIKEMLLSAFLVLGLTGGLVGVGVACIIFTLIFAAVTSHSAMAKDSPLYERNRRSVNPDEIITG